MGGSRGNVSLYQTLGENENIQVAVQGHFQSFLKLMNSIMFCFVLKREGAWDKMLSSNWCEERKLEPS